MKLDIRASALSTAAVFAVVYSLCVLLVAVAPDAAVRILGYLFHVDLAGIARPLSWGGVIAGLVVIPGGGAAIAGAMASFYNRLSRA